MKKKVIKKLRRMRAYADIGSHGGLFMFGLGPVGDKYPTLLHIYKKRLLKSFIPVIIEYKV